jgi:hypothetical protein
MGRVQCSKCELDKHRTEPYPDQAEHILYDSITALFLTGPSAGFPANPQT